MPALQQKTQRRLQADLKLLTLRIAQLARQLNSSTELYEAAMQQLAAPGVVDNLPELQAHTAVWTMAKLLAQSGYGCTTQRCSWQSMRGCGN